MTSKFHILPKRIFEIKMNNLIKRFENRTDHENNEELKWSVEDWFDNGLCRAAFESLVKSPFDLALDPCHFSELKDYARRRHLQPNNCLSTFLNSKKSDGEWRYYYRCTIEKKALASIFIKNSNDEKLKKVQSELTMEKLMHMEDFFFLFENCDSNVFIKLFECWRKDVSFIGQDPITFKN